LAEEIDQLRATLYFDDSLRGCSPEEEWGTSEQEIDIYQTRLQRQGETVMARVFGDRHGGHQIIITAKTTDVLSALKINREKHIASYEEAKSAFFNAAAKLLEDALQEVSEGKFRSINVTLAKPVSYVKQYDTAIRMFDLHLAAGKETVELDYKQVDSLVHDDWDWTKGYNETVSAYGRLQGMD
jgi:hypothetical protein